MTKASVVPGSYTRGFDRRGRFEQFLGELDGPAFVVADERVLRLHPRAARAVAAKPHVALRAGESVKSLRTIERLAVGAARLPRDATIVALGGGTIGDVTTVFAHLHKRGTRLIHAPTTWLAAVDSSLGGKGAVNVAGVKNALGVFHSAVECWLCDELFTTLTPAQRTEGEAEAWKMALTLDEQVWRTWRLARPDDLSLITTSRELKARVCDSDPWERTGQRAVLNFGHTLGHVIESATRYRVRHGVAVALGMRCALDVGVALGVTPAELARDADRRLPLAGTARQALARVFESLSLDEVGGWLRSDKKGADTRSTTFVLLTAPGRSTVQAVPNAVWRRLLRTWSAG